MGHIQHLRRSGPLRWDGIKRERRPGTSREPEETTEYPFAFPGQNHDGLFPLPAPSTFRQHSPTCGGVQLRLIRSTTYLTWDAISKSDGRHDSDENTISRYRQHRRGACGWPPESVEIRQS
jgi:hypothetical protein